ncbi:cell wall-associated NlpC family hydrolase [Flavobacterium sp. PL11]|jgi:cell wall-associated NlpC family hydrolase|uniref:LysM peptidoglycan-binding domain-containing protein n=1 Tax=Flavobacterium sp. PL11 TaxID=3071717 RepID=UPI002DFA0D90|nr:cell wall-associated NlpC family hydrolase [Flavobacterium sp. PL11]
MSLRIIVLLVLINTSVLFSQQKTKKHIIVKGETISSIAQKYDVKQNAIFKLNPKAKNLLKLNSVLLIPIASDNSALSKATEKSKSTLIVYTNNTQQHEVKAKETLYGIAKQYGTSVKELNLINSNINLEDLKIGQKISIPANSSISPIVEVANKPNLQNQQLAASPTESPLSPIEWEVLPKETKYSIAKKYGISIKQFDHANPNIGVKALRVGQRVTIPVLSITNAGVATASPTVSDKSNIEVSSKTPLFSANILGDSNEIALLANRNLQSITREVLPKETKYAIAREYGITVKELEDQNPEIKELLLVGVRLNITAPKVAIAESIISINGESSDHIKASKINFNTNSKAVFDHAFFDELIERAAENIGTRYRTGGTTKSGFDCSGLMLTTFGAFDIVLPRTSREQSSVGTKINTDEAQKGDLIFFKTNGRRHINHVGMVVEVNADEIKFIHSSVTNGVIISSTKERYYGKNFSQINRVVQ